MISNIDTRWQQIPPRGSRRYKILMGMLMKNFKSMVVNVQLANPDMVGLRPITRQWLKSFTVLRKEYSEKSLLFNLDTWGLGRILYDLQPYMLPWVKIAKVKLAKEFRHYLQQCISVHNRRGYAMRLESPWLVIPSHPSNFSAYYDLKYLSIVGWKQVDVSGHRVSVQNTAVTERIDTAIKKLQAIRQDCHCVAICKTATGRACLGVVQHDYHFRIDARAYLLTSKLQFDPKVISERRICSSLRTREQVLPTMYESQ